MRYLIIIFLLLLLGYILITIYSSIEARTLVKSYARLHKAKSTSNDTKIITKHKTSYKKVRSYKELSPSENTRVLFFSDLHAEYCFIPADVVCNSIRESKVDAVVFGGDICNDPLKYKTGINYLQTIKATCDELGIPFLGVTGNHDIHLTSEQIHEAGFFDLRKNTYELKDLLFSGVNDTGRKQRVWADNPVSDTNGKTHVLISHNPDWMLYAADKGQLTNVDHMLSGHIHGGQFRFPFRIEIMMIRKDILPRRKVEDGVFDGGGLTFFISRGIGCVLIPFRFLAKPEITVVEFEK